MTGGEAWVMWGDAAAIVKLDQHGPELEYFRQQGWLSFDGLCEWRLRLPRRQALEMLFRGFVETFNQNDRYATLPKEAP